MNYVIRYDIETGEMYRYKSEYSQIPKVMELLGFDVDEDLEGFEDPLEGSLLHYDWIFYKLLLVPVSPRDVAAFLHLPTNSLWISEKSMDHAEKLFHYVIAYFVHPGLVRRVLKMEPHDIQSTNLTYKAVQATAAFTIGYISGLRSSDEPFYEMVSCYLSTLNKFMSQANPDPVIYSFMAEKTLGIPPESIEWFESFYDARTGLIGNDGLLVCLRTWSDLDRFKYLVITLLANVITGYIGYPKKAYPEWEKV